LHVEGRGFEENVGLSGGEPGADVVGFALAGAKNRIRIEPIRVGDPAQASRGDSGDAIGDAVAGAEFVGAVFQQTD